MQLYYYRETSPNFGDELNSWLWPKLIPELLSQHDNSIFLGIGSILYDTFDPAAIKRVFGAGYAGYTRKPRLDANWHVYFVRGPRTAVGLGLDASKGLGDGATLIRLVKPPAVARRYAVSLIPHWESLEYGVWEAVAQEAGVHLIDPRWPVETVLEHMMASGKIVSEAMHGAIVADALRVPWVPVRPLMKSHQPKWLDWADSLGLTPRFVELGPSSWLEAARRTVQSNRDHLRFVSWHGKPHARRLGFLWRHAAARALGNAAQSEPQLSTDAAIGRATDAMAAQLDLLRRDVLALAA